MENSLKQYIDLFAAHRDLIEKNSASGMNVPREHAFRNLKETGLPQKGSENYEVSDIPAMLAPDYGLNIARIPIDVNVEEAFRCGLPNLGSSLFFMLNDRWAESRNARKFLPEGVEIGPLSKYMEAGGEAVNYYGKIADLANPVVAFNTMLVQEGIFIKVKKGVKVERPVQLVNLLENLAPLLTLRRLVIVLEEGSELKLLSCEHTVSINPELAVVNVVEFFVGKNARFDYYEMEESSSNTNKVSALYLQQEEGSDVLIDSITLRNGRTRNEFHCAFAGENSSLKLYGLGIENHESVLDNYSRISHNIGNCQTEELFKYIVDDNARGAFTGRIYVAPGACKTEAYQSNRNLLGNATARMFSKPQLEIYNDDVKCSHGSATGQLDAMQLFYMETRGIEEDVARLLLKQAFLADIIDAVRLPILRDRLHNLVEKRFVGQEAGCGDCELCVSPAKD